MCSLQQDVDKRSLYAASLFLLHYQNEHADSPCVGVRLEEQDMEKALLSAIRTQVQIMLHPAGTDQKVLTTDSLQEALRECQAAISRNKAAQTAAFEDYAEGRISKQEYLSRKKETARQQEEALHNTQS